MSKAEKKMGVIKGKHKLPAVNELIKNQPSKKEKPYKLIIRGRELTLQEQIDKEQDKYWNWMYNSITNDCILGRYASLKSAQQAKASIIKKVKNGEFTMYKEIYRAIITKGDMIWI